MIRVVRNALKDKKDNEHRESPNEEYRELSVEDILKADENNYAIPNLEIIEVVLKKLW